MFRSLKGLIAAKSSKRLLGASLPIFLSIAGITSSVAQPIENQFDRTSTNQFNIVRPTPSCPTPGALSLYRWRRPGLLGFMDRVGSNQPVNQCFQIPPGTLATIIYNGGNLYQLSFVLSDGVPRDAFVDAMDISQELAALRSIEQMEAQRRINAARERKERQEADRRLEEERQTAAQKQEADRLEAQAKRVAEEAARKQEEAENSPDNVCKTPEIAGKIIDQLNQMSMEAWQGEKAIDLIHVTTVSVDPAKEQISCHLTVVMSRGPQHIGTYSERKNIADRLVAEFNPDPL